MFATEVFWSEIPVLNFERAKRFYSRIYNIDLPEIILGSKRMGYLKLSEEKGSIAGAIVQGANYQPSTSGPKLFLSGDPDINKILNEIESAGGSIISPKKLISPELGYVAVFGDTEGNQISLHSSAV